MNRILRLSVVLGSFLVTLSVADTARCELITVEFFGTVTSVTVSFEYRSFDFPDVGDSFSGYYKFDANARDTAASPEQGSYHTVLPTTAVGVTIGGFQFEGRASGILTFQKYYEVGDWIPSIELISNPALAQSLNRNQFSLIVREENLFSDPNVLPLTPPSLLGADQASLVMYLDDRNDTFPDSEVVITATLQSLRLVPEPCGAVLLGVEVLLLLPIRERRFPKSPPLTTSCRSRPSMTYGMGSIFNVT